MTGETVDLQRRVQRHPYGLVAGALGLGFVLGGGLFTRFTARIVGAGVRMGLVAVLPLLKEEMARFIGRAVAGSNSETRKEDAK